MSAESARKFEASVVIGRFQPFHAAHLRLLQRALSLGQRAVVVLGSHRSPVTIRNPWTTDERREMIREAVGADRDRLLFAPVRDYLYNDDLWVIAVQQAVTEVLGSEFSGRIALVGFNKDRTCYYLALFPQWDLSNVHVPAQEQHAINATDIRDDLFVGGARYQDQCPAGTARYVQAWMNRQGSAYLRLRDEYEHVVAYKAAWGGAPYQPTFVTADAVVVCAGHVLVVRRRCQPGAGSIALPGGFIRGDERVVDAALRELKEETSILLPREELRAHLRDRAVFDHPDRSLRGRTITHAIYIRLPDGPMPRVKGADDADKAWWMPLADVFAREEEFFEDHVQIIQHFVSKH